MNYLLDTCVLSEFTKRQPNPQVVRWVAEADESMLFLSAISIGEIRRGIEKMPASRHKEELTVWFNDRVLRRFGDRILPIDAQTMLLWGALTARLEAHGAPMLVFDSLIAVTAQTHNLTLVTRNEDDFANTGVILVNPWK